jgi:hypothetical protein
MADDRLLLARAEIRRIERSLRVVKKLVAQELDSRAAETNDSQETDEYGNREQDGVEEG